MSAGSGATATSSPAIPVPTLPGMPPFLDPSQTSYAQILAQMLAALPSSFDQAEGSFFWDTQAPAALQLASAAIYAQQVLARGFAQYTYGAYLDLRANEHGIVRLPAVGASGIATFTGIPGTFIPLGTLVSTASAVNVPAQGFQTTAVATLPPVATVTTPPTLVSTIDVPILATTLGAASNVGANTITYLTNFITGIVGVANADATTGGLDPETDAALLARYLFYVRNPAAGGNVADYVDWALQVPGVGNATVESLWNGPGTVAVYILDRLLNPASTALLAAVQAYIYPTASVTHQALAMTPVANVTQFTNTSAVPVYSGYQLLYSGAGLDASVYDGGLNAALEPYGAGLWLVTTQLGVSAITTTTSLVVIGVWNLTQDAWCTTTVSGVALATVTYAANALTPTLGATAPLQFFWNGVDAIQLRVIRPSADADQSTVVYFVSATYTSLFQSLFISSSGKAPIGAQVTVLAPTIVPITIQATLHVDTSLDLKTILDGCTAAVNAYLAGVIAGVDPTVRFTGIARAILNVTGVLDYASLSLNGGTGNVAYLPSQIPQIITPPVWQTA